MVVHSVKCPLGKFASNKSNSACTEAPAGYMVDSEGATSYKSCTKGSFSAKGATQCSPCSPGKYSSGDHATTCDPCLPGKFAQDFSSTTCQVGSLASCNNVS